MKNRSYTDIDESMKVDWNKSYKVKKSQRLWPDNPVPFLDQSLQFFKETNGSLFLDFPCGDGKNLVSLAKSLPFVLAADVAMNALEIVARVLDGAGVRNVVLLRDDLFDSRLMSDQFDGVFSCDVLGHLRTPRRAMTELLRILRPGGRLVGTAFSPGDSTRGIDMVSIGNEEYLYKEKFYYKFYSEEEIRKLVDLPRTKVIAMDLHKWEEPPHEGFREYYHEHESWVFALEKL